MPDDAFFQPLKDFLSKVPAVTGTVGSGFTSAGLWWVKSLLILSIRWRGTLCKSWVTS